MTVRLAVFQRDNRPLEGLCAQLQCAGYDVFERYTEDALLELISRSEVDVLLFDAGEENTQHLLEKARAHSAASSVRMVLIADESSTILDQLSASSLIDDVITLPTHRHDLRFRLRNMARFASMSTELERRLNTFSDFGIAGEHQQSSSVSSNEQPQILLVGPMDSEQIPLIDMLGGIAAFAYATTTDHAWHQLGQSSFDTIIITNKLAFKEVRKLCRRLGNEVTLSDLPVLLCDDSATSTEIESICFELNVDCLRAQSQPIVMKKRLQMALSQYRLKRRLRGLLSDGHCATIIDNLTGLYGRAFLYQYLGHSIQENRSRHVPLSVATCTISGLAKVNSSLGYPVGERVIGDLGRAIAKNCRAQDLVARVRGASFCVVLNDTSESEARAVCKRLVDVLQEVVTRSLGDRASLVDLRIGRAQMAASDKAETLIDRALQQLTTNALCEAS